MERVVNFYAGLPRGPAPQVKPTGLIGRYQARYFSGKNASAVRKYWSYLEIGMTRKLIEQPLSTLLAVS
jgi:hypothetical protein